MEHLHVQTFRDLVGPGQSAKILCAIRGIVVRTLSRVDADHVKVNFGKDPEGKEIEATINLDTKIDYQPWFMDRGSMIFDTDKKICTEYDVLVDERGQQSCIVPMPLAKSEAIADHYTV